MEKSSIFSLVGMVICLIIIIIISLSRTLYTQSERLNTCYGDIELMKNALEKEISLDSFTIPASSEIVSCFDREDTRDCVDKDENRLIIVDKDFNLRCNEASSVCFNENLLFPLGNDTYALYLPGGGG